MKNLLIYINPNNKKFEGEYENAVKIQIENSLALGWKPKDIVLVTNFDYEYQGVKSLIIGDENYCEFFWPATKIYSIVALFRQGLIKKDLYWYHDFDCFQLNPFVGDILEGASMGLTNYGRMPRLCSASMFFTEKAGDIFERIKEEVDNHQDGHRGEEEAIAKIINSEDGDDLKMRVKLLNLTYALHKFNFWHCYCRSDKPIKAVHFHLTPDKYDFWVKGNNKVQLKIIPKRLVKIFNKHGFK